MRYRLVVAALAAGCLDSPPSTTPGDAGSTAGADAAPFACACPAEPCPFRLARAVRLAPSLVPADLSQVPVLVRVEVSDDMAPDGSDLRFATQEGELLPHEIELFGTPGSVASVWVGLPSLRGGVETSFCLFYGAEQPGAAADSAGVWDSGFAGVWHLGESAAGAPGELADSTSHVCNGQGGDTSSDATLPQQAPAMVGLGQELDGDAVMDFGDASHLDLVGTGVTLEAWVLMPALGIDYMALVGKEGFTAGYRMLVGPAGQVLFQLTDGERRVESADGVAPAGSWHYIAATYDGASMKIYVDGRKVRQKSETGDIDTTGAPMQMGVSNGDYWLVGTLDEVRISTVSRPVEWLVAQRAAVLGDLVSVGDEQGL